MKSDWFVANKHGLRQIAERLVEERGFGIIGAELYQNMMDTNATEGFITLEKLVGKPQAIITCQDNDPNGFSDLSHAWTMFAPSEKKADPTKAGRFNLGEKMVLSFCREATICTTKGTVVFNDEGRIDYPRRKQECGTMFKATIDCTQERYEQFLDFMKRLIIRPNLRLVVNGVEIQRRQPAMILEMSLPTVTGDTLSKTVRKTKVELHTPLDGEVAMIYELGIPVVETGDKWHYNVLQKVPLNVDRDNVTPAYLRDLRLEVYNSTYIDISGDEITSAWVQDATSQPECKPEAVQQLLVEKFGEKSLAIDPTNQEANNYAVAHGFNLVPARGLSPGQRANLKSAGLLLSTTQQFPMVGLPAYSDDPNAKQVEIIPKKEWTPAMLKVCRYTEELSLKALRVPIVVEFVKCKNAPSGKNWQACFGNVTLCGVQFIGEFHFNCHVLDQAWFEKVMSGLDGLEELDELFIHELGHHYEPNHLSAEYYKALCRIGAKIKRYTVEHPTWMQQWF